MTLTLGIGLDATSQGQTYLEHQDFLDVGDGTREPTVLRNCPSEMPVLILGGTPKAQVSDSSQLSSETERGWAVCEQ